MTALKEVQQRNRVDFFPTKSRLPNTDSIDRLSAALEDLKHEYTPSSTNYPVVESKHGTNLNKAIKRTEKLFQLAITTASNLINDLPPFVTRLSLIMENSTKSYTTTPMRKNLYTDKLY